MERDEVLILHFVKVLQCKIVLQNVKSNVDGAKIILKRDRSSIFVKLLQKCKSFTFFVKAFYIFVKAVFIDIFSGK